VAALQDANQTLNRKPKFWLLLTKSGKIMAGQDLNSEGRSMSSGLVEVFSIRPVHPCYKFTPGGFGPGLIPAGHARLYAHHHLKPHNFLVPLPDNLAATGKQDRTGFRLQA